MTMTVTLVDREVWPKHDNGVDWSGDRVILARRKHHTVLWWRRSGKYWRDRISGYVTSPAELELYYPEERPAGWRAADMEGYLNDDSGTFRHGMSQHTTLSEGGRLGRERLWVEIAVHQKLLTEKFGRGILMNYLDIRREIVSAYRQKKTLVIQ